MAADPAGRVVRTAIGLNRLAHGLGRHFHVPAHGSIRIASLLELSNWLKLLLATGPTSDLVLFCLRQGFLFFPLGQGCRAWAWGLLKES